MLELHVWGPAFGLPSLDAHCLAAIAYLQQAVPRGKWQLIASCNPALSPTNELPALRNGDIWIGGFRNIFHYLAQCSAGEWVLDAGLPEQEGADCIAFSSFVESHGQPLIDLSLYVSSQNYTTTTRPLYSTLLPFPLPYLIPPSIRALAKQRTTHLGLSSLDVDSTDDTPPPTSQSIIPPSLRLSRPSVSSLLASTPEASAQIRLDALATSFFTPLSALLAKKKFFVSNSQFSSLDCLVLGYLSLMLVPELPQPWLAQCLRRKYPSLATWTETLRATVFGKEDVTVDHAFLTKLGDSELDARLKRLRGKGHLPWKAADSGGAVGVGSVFLSGVADGIPIVGQLRRNTRMRQHGGQTLDDGESSRWQYLSVIGSVVAGLGAVAGWMWWQGLLGLEEGGEGKGDGGNGGLGAMGEAGEALGFYARAMDEQVRRQRVMEEMNSTGTIPVAEVNVEVEVEK